MVLSRKEWDILTKNKEKDFIDWSESATDTSTGVKTVNCRTATDILLGDEREKREVMPYAYDKEWAEIGKQPHHHHQSHPFEFIFRLGLKGATTYDLVKALGVIVEEISFRERDNRPEG